MKFKVGDLVRRRNPRNPFVGLVLEVGPTGSWINILTPEGDRIQMSGDMELVQ